MIALFLYVDIEFIVLFIQCEYHFLNDYNTKIKSNE